MYIDQIKFIFVMSRTSDYTFTCTSAHELMNCITSEKTLITRKSPTRVVTAMQSCRMKTKRLIMNVKTENTYFQTVSI